MQKTIYVEPQITRHSLVGIWGSAPYEYGNYFWIGQYYVVNMWMENLKHLLESGQIQSSDKLEAIEVGGKILITDSRIPKEFLNQKLCFNGCGGVMEEYQALYKASYGESNHCYCDRAHNYASYAYQTATVGRVNGNTSKGFCRCCEREMFFTSNDGNRIEIAKSEYDLLMKNN